MPSRSVRNSNHSNAMPPAKADHDADRELRELITQVAVGADAVEHQDAADRVGQ